jgi:hypothetical protein
MSKKGGKQFITLTADKKIRGPEIKEDDECAFHITTSDNVCSDQYTLAKMTEFINSLEKSSVSQPIANRPAEIVKKAKKLTGCNTESCVIKNKKFSSFIGEDTANKIIKTRFKPEGPAKSTEWLNNENIDFVINQWSKIYNGFLHVPFQMIDFDKMGTSLAKINLCESYDKGTRKMGCVINTDDSSGSGIHWFCIFIDISQSTEWTLEYFDSAGEYPKESVHKWLNEQRLALTRKFPDKKINVIDVTKSNQLQKSTTECGVFCLWYILSRLNGIPYSYFSQPNAVSDDMMYKFRKFLFRHKDRS